MIKESQIQYSLEKIYPKQKIKLLTAEMPKRTSHEVYFVSFERNGKNEKLVFKFQPHDVPEYKSPSIKKEVYVITQLEKSGLIEVPHVVYHANNDGIIDMDFFVMTPIDGIPMSELIKVSSLEQKKAHVREAANIIAMVHSIPISQFPEMPKQDYPNVVINRHIRLYDGLKKYASVISHKDFGLMERTIEYLKNKRPITRDEALLNGDFSPEHFIRRNNGKYVLLDWDPVEIGDRSWDIYWMVKEASQFVFGYEGSLDDLLKQYEKDTRKPLDNKEYYKNAAVSWAYILGWYIEEKIPGSHLIPAIRKYREHFSERIEEFT